MDGSEIINLGSAACCCQPSLIATPQIPVAKERSSILRYMTMKKSLREEPEKYSKAERGKHQNMFV
jgi:hypothetical protein